jgi:hypothetical protein
LESLPIGGTSLLLLQRGLELFEAGVDLLYLPELSLVLQNPKAHSDEPTRHARPVRLEGAAYDLLGEVLEQVVKVLGDLGAVALAATGSGTAALVGVCRVVKPTMVLVFWNATRTPIAITLCSRTLTVQLRTPPLPPILEDPTPNLTAEWWLRGIERPVTALVFSGGGGSVGVRDRLAGGEDLQPRRDLTDLLRALYVFERSHGYRIRE